MKHQTGWSVIQILMTLAIIGILTITLMPAWQTLIKNTRMNRQIQDVLQTLYLARNEALRQSVTITLCPYISTTQCGTDWSLGILAFVDASQNRQPNMESYLFHTEPLADGSELRWEGFPSHRYLSLLPNGNSHNGTFVLCDLGRSSQGARGLIISKTGRIKLTQDALGDGIHRDRNGDPLSC